MDAVHERLAEARTAHARRDWPAAYRLLADLRHSGALTADDLFLLGDAAWWLGLIRETLEACEECYRRYVEEGRTEDAATVALGTGYHWLLRGEPDLGSGWISRGRRLVEDLPPGPAHGFLLSIEADERLESGDVVGALDRAARLRLLADDLGEPVLACFALSVEGQLAIRSGDPDRGFGLLDEAMLPVLAGTVAPDMAGNLYCQMMTICHELADVSRARRWTATTESWSASFASAVMFVGICRVHRSQLRRLEGDWDAAATEAARAVDELAELNVVAVAEARYELGEIHRLRGDLAGAAEQYAGAEELGRDPQPGAALLLLAQGRAEEAEASVRLHLAEVDDPFVRARLLRALGEIGLARESATTIEAAARELTTIAERFGSPGFRAWAATARGAAMLLAGDAAAALTALRAALSAYRTMGASYDVALTRLLIARALAADEDDAAAAEETAAWRTLAELGAAPPPGTRAPSPAPPAGLPGGLTAREAEILVAIAEGLSNRDVAARLVISEKTVARHLANIYAKLEVTSRTAAAAWAHRHGLMPTA